MPNPTELARQAEQLDDEQWYAFLDELDEVTHRRRQRIPPPVLAPGSSRDDVAAWVAKQHFIADSSIREIWYLPGEAPADEIRLLEVNDRIGGAGGSAQAIDFGLDVEGVRFRLLVADVDSEQLSQIKQNASLLPPNWSLAGSRSWRRGA